MTHLNNNKSVFLINKMGISTLKKCLSNIEIKFSNHLRETLTSVKKLREIFLHLDR